MLGSLKGRREEAEAMFVSWAENKKRVIGTRAREERASVWNHEPSFFRESARGYLGWVGLVR